LRMAQKGYLGNGPYEVWHSGADFRMFAYHGHGSEARRPSVGPPIGQGPRLNARQRRTIAQP